MSDVVPIPGRWAVAAVELVKLNPHIEPAPEGMIDRVMWKLREQRERARAQRDRSIRFRRVPLFCVEPER